MKWGSRARVLIDIWYCPMIRIINSSVVLVQQIHFSLVLVLVPQFQCWASYFLKVTSYILHITCN